MGPSELPAGAEVGVDANVFILHFCGRSPESTAFLRWVEAGEVRAFTTQEVLAEVMHRLMVLEAVAAGAVSGGNPARSLRRKPDIVKELHRYYDDTSAISAMGVRVLPPPVNPLDESHRFRRDAGLLTNDSLLAAVMGESGVRVLVTGDRDFLRVADLDVALVTE